MAAVFASLRDQERIRCAAMTRDNSYCPRCISIDLEVGRADSRIQAIGAIRADTDRRYLHTGRVTKRTLAALDRLADGADFVLGHNVIEFDLPHLESAKPDLRLLQLPVIDTLRLSPLAFPQNSYHRLIKHYKDAGLLRAQLNNPELDARLTLEVFHAQRTKIKNASPNLLVAWHWLTTPNFESVDSALDEFFTELRQSPRPSDEYARIAIGNRLEGETCATEGRKITLRSREYGWSLAYALAWLSVAGGNSVMPPWVRHQFPEAGQLVRCLRDKACSKPACSWCRERHDAKRELKRWFNFEEFRAEPRHIDERPMQQAIVEEAMAGNHVLGILPTGTGKSLCYQIPALSRYNKTGALTVVISPLVALMADQVAGLENHGISSCVAINTLLSMPERSDALDKVRLGDTGILLIAPEQLRSNSVRRVLDQREIGAWILDEAHCLSRWGHDFRPDYRYIGRYISEKAGTEKIPPVLCLTATANLNVIDDIVCHFEDKLNIKLKVFNGGSERTNLDYEIIPTTEPEKFNLIHELLEFNLPRGQPGGAIVYCATRRLTEEVAEYLRNKDVTADHFHAGLQPEIKKDVQQRFIKGDLRAIAATNAFGMGIDKSDVRLVIHADIPGSLENYFQEAGRAGRDGEIARCVLLYDSQDVERQFGMSARSRLSRVEIAAVLRALRNLNRKKRLKGEVIATAGEILVEDEDQAFERDSATDDNRVRTAITWLEESELLTREENVVNVFPSSLRVNTIEEAKKRLDRANINKTNRDQLLLIAEELINADADEGITTDELVAVTGLSAEGIRNALYTLEQVGIASNDTVLTAYVHAAVERSSKKRLQEASKLESELIAHMRETAPDMAVGESSIFHLRAASQELRNRGLVDPLPAKILRILRSIAGDSRGEDDGASGSISLRSRDAETVNVTLRREWEKLDQIAKKRREAAGCLLAHLLKQLPSGSRGIGLLAETTIGKLLRVVKSEDALMLNVRQPEKLLDRALLWLHEQEVIILNKGLVVFRPAMLIRLEQKERRGFSSVDYRPLADYYKGKVFQIHVMVEFAKKGLKNIANANRLARDYFGMNSDEFFARWFSGRDNEIGRETTPESWRSIVKNLKNPTQQKIVADTREQTNVLVLAGPGSGKTRVLVHRIAYLVRARRENPRGILALVYNRHAAVEIRRRLRELIGEESSGVTILTCHALAMRLVGVTFDNKERVADDNQFQDVLRDAVKLLRGKDLPTKEDKEEADEQRERLLAGFRWILVDEYQDIGSDEYELISAVAGRTLEDDSRKLTLFAVGDDDQNIYAFKGASVEFIRRFESDYGPNSGYLTANYRSTFHIIEAANTVIAPASERMKVGNSIQINRERRKDAHGGEWQQLDPVARGRVQILPVGKNRISQAQTVVSELQRLTKLESENWSRCAVISRQWSCLHTVRAVCETHKIPVQMGDEQIPRFYWLRETQQFIEWVRGHKSSLLTAEMMREWIWKQSSNRWYQLIRQSIDEFDLETCGAEMPVTQFIEWFAEWGHEIRRRQRGLLLLTAHRAKGLEFDHVAVLDGNWKHFGNNEDADAARRLYYVAMTRAKKNLILAKFDSPHPFLRELYESPSILLRSRIDLPDASVAFNKRYIQPDLSEVDLGFAGRFISRHRVHSAISGLSPGDPLKVRIDENKGSWELLNQKEIVVGRLAKKFEPPKGMRCKSAEVYAIVKRNCALSDLKYRDSIKCDSWEVVVPRFVFESASKPK